jgi:uncharacterized protein YgbK (DUF1537 family)
VISIIVGSMTEITGRQIVYLQDIMAHDENGYYKNVILHHLKGGDFRGITDKKFLMDISISRTLIMSGGETAYSLLNESGFDHLISGNQIMPLVSTGIICGGLFNGIHYIIKGGSIGEIDIYEKIIEYAMDNFEIEKKNS